MTTIHFQFCIFTILVIILGFSGFVMAEETPPMKPETISPSPSAPVAKENKDPCAVYSYEYYIVCKDRMRKIQSMLDARDQRNNSTKPKTAPAPETTSPIITDDSKSK